MNSCAQPLAQAAEAARWQAQLSLQFGMRIAASSGTGGSIIAGGQAGRPAQAKCALLANRHLGPLYVQRPFYPEGMELAHVYLLHPPGGLVSGDQLDVSLVLEENSAVLCTTPGAARLYQARRDGALQQQVNRLQVGEGASLEWLPQETLVYRGSNAALETRVELAAGARFMGWEIVALGLQASAQAFDAGCFKQRFVIAQQGMPVFVDRMQVDGKDLDYLQGSAALQGRVISGCFICGPFDNGSDVQTLIRTFREGVPDTAARVGATLLGSFVVLRYLGECSEEAKRLFVQAWTTFRPLLLKRPACAPRIWST